VRLVNFYDSSAPLVFAHRGGCALGPENTMAAFELGMTAGADGLELDVHLSADGVVVVHHDDTLDRTTNASGPVTGRTAAELARVDAGFRFAQLGGFPFRDSGIGVPTLREVLERFRDTRIIVELKMDEPELGRALAEEVKRAGAVDRVCAAGYGRRSADAARAALPEMASSACHSEVRLALYRSWLRWPVRDVAYGGYQVPELAGPTRVVSPRFLRDAHRAGLKVQIWTVDDEAEAARLLQWGADGLISNRPDMAVRVRDRLARRSPETS
jgi:glycerophosphoryl diester phosphodiesterase